MQVSIRHGQKVHVAQAKSQDQVLELMKQAEEATGVLVRKQKLVFKGKVLAASMTLDQAKVKEGSTLMLIAAASQMTQVSLQKHAALVPAGDRHQIHSIAS